MFCDPGGIAVSPWNKKNVTFFRGREVGILPNFNRSVLILLACNNLLECFSKYVGAKYTNDEWR
jgi:hypothetical protein